MTDPEHAVNLQVALKLRDALAAEGARVVMVREVAAVNISNIERATMMNDAGADLVLRIHCNGVRSPNPRGMSMHVRKTGPKAAESRAAAGCLLKGMREATGAVSRGVVRSNDDSQAELSEEPSMLIETGFGSLNPEEEQLLISGEYQDKLVEGMVEGVAAFFENRALTGAGIPGCCLAWDFSCPFRKSHDQKNCLENPRAEAFRFKDSRLCESAVSTHSPARLRG